MVPQRPVVPRHGGFLPGPPHVQIGVGHPGYYGPIHVNRVPVYRAPIVVRRTYHRPIITRPTVIVRRSPVVVYNTQDTLHLRHEISALRAEILHTRFADSGFYPLVRDILDDASDALNDADDMLRWGYARHDIAAALHDARAHLEYAQYELDYGRNALNTYRSHALAQIEETRHYADDAYFRPHISSDLYEARRLFEDAELAARSILRQHEALSLYEQAAQRADQSMSRVHALTYAHLGEDAVELISEHQALDAWASELHEVATQWGQANIGREIERAGRELERARDLIQRQRLDDARQSLSEAAHLLQNVYDAMNARY